MASSFRILSLRFFFSGFCIAHCSDLRVEYATRFRFFPTTNESFWRGLPRPPEIGRATQQEPFAMEQLTAGASEYLLTDHVREGRSSFEMSDLGQIARFFGGPDSRDLFGNMRTPL